MGPSVLLSPEFIRLSTGICFGSYGLKIMMCDGPKPVNPPAPAGSLASRVKAYCHEYFSRKKQEISSGQFHIIYGAFFLGSGISGTVAALHQLGMINIGKAYALFNNLEMSLFMTGCIVGIYHNVKEYRRVANDLSLTPAEAHKQKLSAILALVSSLNYILWGALTVLGAPAAVALVFGCIGLATGCLKIIYDFYHSS